MSRTVTNPYLVHALDYNPQLTLSLKQIYGINCFSTSVSVVWKHHSESVYYRVQKSVLSFKVLPNVY